MRQPRSSPMVSPGLGTPEEHNIYLWAIIFHSLGVFTYAISSPGNDLLPS